MVLSIDGACQVEYFFYSVFVVEFCIVGDKSEFWVGSKVDMGSPGGGIEYLILKWDWVVFLYIVEYERVKLEWRQVEHSSSLSIEYSSFLSIK